MWKIVFYGRNMVHGPYWIGSRTSWDIVDGASGAQQQLHNRSRSDMSSSSVHYPLGAA